MNMVTAKVCRFNSKAAVLLISFIARLISTLALVQQKLAHLDSENTTSRHRMLELERELDGCKQEVVRERERVLQREDIIKRQQMQRSDTAARGTKGKGRAEEDVAEVQKRYKQAVEEKKGQSKLPATCHVYWRC